MKKVIIIQARMGSSRLPGKVLKLVLGKPLLEFQIERLQKIKNIDEVIIATSNSEKDDPIIDLCNRLSIPFYRGSENDVLSRFYNCASNYNADVIVRLTADCPVIDPFVVEGILNCYLGNIDKYDYVSNTLERSFPRGMDTEVFSFKILSEAYREAKQDFEREHVTPFIYRNPERYSLSNYALDKNESRHRWTVDTIEDFSLIEKIIKNLYPKNLDFSLDDILKLIYENPEWSLINEHIEQKKI